MRSTTFTRGALYTHIRFSALKLDELPLPSDDPLPTKVEAGQYLGIGITVFDELRILVRLGRRRVYVRVDLNGLLHEYKSSGAG